MKRVLLLTAVVLTGCATASKDVPTTYVSPIQYQPYSCDQLAAESARLVTRANELAGRLDQAASNDKALVATAFVFWPVLFAVGGTKQQEAEYARLRGEHDAVTQAAIAKSCVMPSSEPKLQPASTTPPSAPAPEAPKPAVQEKSASAS